MKIFKVWGFKATFGALKELSLTETVGHQAPSAPPVVLAWGEQLFQALSTTVQNNSTGTD